MANQNQGPEGSRPAPQYGEYAPEGWEWKPPVDEARAQADAAEATRLTGVPHNLGASPGGRPQAPAGDPPPYRAGEPVQRTRSALKQDPAYQRLSVDRVFTVVLLVIGALGAIYLALSLFGMPQSIQLMASALGLESFEAPGWLGPVSTVTALFMFALYAITLIWSIQRMRAPRMTFWVPLTAGVLSVALTFVMFVVIVLGMPDFMQALADPTATDRILEYAGTIEP